MVLESTYFLLI